MLGRRDSFVVELVLVLCLGLWVAQCARIYMDACDDKKGFICVKSLIFNGRFDVTFFCNARTTWDVEFYLWQFRAIATISSLTIVNCTNVIVHLQCTSELKHVQYLRIANVTNLSLPPPVHGLTQTPSEVFLENIQHIDTISTRTFIQIKKFPFNRYGCINNPNKDLESIVFKNVGIGTIERESFFNLTNIRNFTFDNVTIGKIESSAALVFLDKEAELKITGSNITSMEFMSFNIRGNKISFLYNIIKEMHTTAIKAAVYTFDFLSNRVSWVHCGSMSILARSVKICDSHFDYLAAGAFQTIGPGLPENALQGFGDLNFSFEFKNNLVESLEVASLHPDWRAYKKVGGNLVITYNALKCSCAELAWLGHKEGFGKEFSSLDQYHEKILDKENKNICIDAPCNLPVDVVRFLIIKDGRCLHNFTQEDMCKIYYPVTTTKKYSFIQPAHTTPHLQFFKRPIYSASKSKCSYLEINKWLIFGSIIVIFKVLLF